MHVLRMCSHMNTCYSFLFYDLKSCYFYCYKIQVSFYHYNDNKRRTGFPSIHFSFCQLLFNLPISTFLSYVLWFGIVWKMSVFSSVLFCNFQSYLSCLCSYIYACYKLTTKFTWNYLKLFVKRFCVDNKRVRG